VQSRPDPRFQAWATELIRENAPYYGCFRDEVAKIGLRFAIGCLKGHV
jgi:hypothetical protein